MSRTIELLAALFEVCFLLLTLTLIVWLREALLSHLKSSILLTSTLMMLTALAAIILPKRSLRAYGFLPQTPTLTMRWSAIIMGIFILPALASIAISAVLESDKRITPSPQDIAVYMAFYMVFVGLIEEAIFRGYMQSRLNEVLERRWRRLIFKSWRVHYGLGLLLTSILFALVHVANYWNPLIQRWEPVWWMPIHILGSLAFGCIAGALRESSGDIYVPASLHGSVMTAYSLLSTYTSELALNISLFISWFIFFYILAFFFREFESLHLKPQSRVGEGPRR